MENKNSLSISDAYKQFRKKGTAYKSFRLALEQAGMHDRREAVSICVTNGEHILMGQRRDTSLYTLPGGGANNGESIYQAAIRELFEETGLMANNLTHIGSTLNESGVYVHSFLYEYQKDIGKPINKITVEFDPDKEVSEWFWVSPESSEWKQIASNLQHPKNITLDILKIEY